MISYGVIKHEIEPGESVPEEYEQTERKIFSTVDVLSRLDVRKTLSMIESDRLDVYI